MPSTVNRVESQKTTLPVDAREADRFRRQGCGNCGERIHGTRHPRKPNALALAFRVDSRQRHSHAFRARFRGIRRQRSGEPADLLDAPRAAAAASHRGNRVAYAGVLSVPGDERDNRDVAGMSAPAGDPEHAAAQAAKPPPFETQLSILPGCGLGLAGA